MAREVVITSAVRTPIGKFQGSLASLPASKLGAACVREAIRRSKLDPALVDEVIMGNVLQAGNGQNPARQAALWGGLPDSINAFTVNKVCGSGMKSVMCAAQAIRAGDIEIAVAGGMENMSRAPYLLDQARTGYRLGHGKLIDSMVHDGLWDVYNDFHMGVAAELIAEKFQVTREEQDRYAVESHKKAVAAIATGKFKDEILPMDVPGAKKGETVSFAVDESPRKETSIEALSSLKPAFKQGGTVTAGNAPSVNDGAAALVVMSAEKAKELGIQPMARILGYAAAGTKPEMVFYAPVLAVRRLLEKLDRKIDAFDLIEANEAFSAQALADGKELGWDWSRVNVHGGAVALGHPIGASGARILATLLYAMRDRGKRLGMGTLCLGGGNAVAMAVEVMG
jgi:acetyl-CoA C-acetyltransferase